jgi:glycosyltransferase involved in cell wall biosynthesis
MNKDHSYIYFLSMLPGNGPTGVETHFNQLKQVLQGQGLETGLISPWVARTWSRRLPNPLLRRLRPFMPEHVLAWSRLLDRRDLAGKLERLVHQHPGGPLVALAQDPNSALAALQVARRHPVKVILTVHFNLSEAQEMMDKGLIRPEGPMWRRTMAAEAAALRGADRVVFVSDFMRRVLTERYPWLDSAKTVVIHNSCEDPGPPTFDEEDFEGDLLAIGTLEARKNQAFLLQVLAECHRLGHRYTLTLAGDGPDRIKLEALAAQLGLEDQVRFLGFIPNASRMLQTHRVLTHAALMENLPITLVEALAYGRPVLAASVGGIPEVVSEGVEGDLWPLEDPAEAAHRLVRILESPTLYDRQALAARQRYERHFTPARFAAEWRHLIEGCLDDSSTGIGSRG